MSNSKRSQHRYDHRLKELVRSTGNIDVAIQRGVPRSTARGWLTKTMSEVITVDVLDVSVAELQCEVISLRRRNTRLIALLRLIITGAVCHDISYKFARVLDTLIPPYYEDLFPRAP